MTGKYVFAAGLVCLTVGATLGVQAAEPLGCAKPAVKVLACRGAQGVGNAPEAVARAARLLVCEVPGYPALTMQIQKADGEILRPIEASESSAKDGLQFRARDREYAYRLTAILVNPMIWENGLLEMKDLLTDQRGVTFSRLMRCD